MRKSEPKIYVFTMIRNLFLVTNVKVFPMKELEEKFEDAQEELDELENEELPQISVNAFNGESSFQTMRVVGIVANKYKLHILVDSGPAHNFLDINVAKRIGCKIIPISPVSITMAGRKQLVSVSECKGFRGLGCEMVLGIQWLATLGDIKCNFKALRMEFVYNNKKLVIIGTPKSPDEWLAGKKRVQRMDYA
ncbi:hypothetical protein Tco_1020721 [Tanacetum coccineum]